MNLSLEESKNLKELKRHYPAVLQAIIRSLELIASDRTVIGETHEKTIGNVYKNEGYKDCIADLKHYFYD